MGVLTKSINSIKEFNFLKEKYKDIAEFQNLTLSFYFLNFNKRNRLENVFKYIQNKYKDYKIFWKVLEENDNELLMFVRVTKIFFKREESCEFLIHLNKENMIITFVSDELSIKINSIIDTFVDRIYPFAKRISIKSEEILYMIDDFRKSNYYLTTSMISIKKWWEKVKRSAVEFPTDVPINEVLTDIKNKKAFINSIIIHTFDKYRKSQLLSFYISRRGLVKFNGGYYKLFEEKVLNEIIKNKQEGIKILTNRQQEGENIKPLSIIFDKLKDVNESVITNEFKLKMQSIKEITLIIYHSGNPFFYADAIDVLDGSSFQLLFHNRKNNSELIIIPQEIATTNSLDNLISNVFTKFGEGTIQDFRNNNEKPLKQNGGNNYFNR